MVEHLRHKPAGLLLCIVLSMTTLVGCRRDPDATAAKSGPDVMTVEQSAQLVARLRARTTSTIDPDSQREISVFIADLADRRGFVDVNGVNRRRSTVAIWRLREMGEPVVPFLLDAAGGPGDAYIRGYALEIVSQIHSDTEDNHDEYLAVFVQAASDPNEQIRLAATGSMISMAHDFGRWGDLQRRDSFVPYLCRALDDEYDMVRYYAARELWSWGRKDCIPPDLIERFRLGTGHHPQVQLDEPPPKYNRTSDRRNE